MSTDRYGSDPLAGFTKRPVLAQAPVVAAERDLVLEHAATGFVGAVVRIESSSVELEDRHGKVRAFPLGAGFLVDGARVTLGPPARRAAAPVRTASGSFAGVVVLFSHNSSPLSRFLCALARDRRPR